MKTIGAHIQIALRTGGGNATSFRAMKWLLDFLKGTWLKHPLHPILVHVPMAMWPGALIFDLLSQWNIGGNAMVRLSFYAIVFGLVVSLLAVPAGLVDWTGIKKEKPVWKIGLYHMVLNLFAAVLFAINLGLRVQDFGDAPTVSRAPLTLSALGTVLLIGSAYLGGRMTYEYGISVARMSKKKWRKIAEAGGASVPEE
jgi:uncharacterized membrane protein